MIVKQFDNSNPRIRIINFSKEMSKEDLKNYIINRKQFPIESVNILHIYKQWNNYYEALAEVTSEIYAKIMSTKFLLMKVVKFMMISI